MQTVISFHIFHSHLATASFIANMAAWELRGDILTTCRWVPRVHQTFKLFLITARSILSEILCRFILTNANEVIRSSCTDSAATAEYISFFINRARQRGKDARCWSRRISEPLCHHPHWTLKLTPYGLSANRNKEIVFGCVYRYPSLNVYGFFP